MQRTSGILLHPTALPGPFKIGDFGEEAFRFIDFLAKAGQSVWQILPLGPTGYGHSPYNALSAFAGNPALIDLRQVAKDGDLKHQHLDITIKKSLDLDFIQTHAATEGLLQEAGKQFFKQATDVRKEAFDSFCTDNVEWLEDFSLFMAIRENFARKAWFDWPDELRTRQPQALQHWQEKLSQSCLLYKYQQYIFSSQWNKIKHYANRNNIQIFGDIPIFVAYDSADVWANQLFFQLDDQGRATAVAGVPPDYFSKTGQRWGNPLYRWEKLAEEDFGWWQKRFEYQLTCSDMIRIDHFRGFQACWSIPATEKTAVNGHWEDVPGRALFENLMAQRPDLPIIAEDLGVITPEVEKLRDDFNFPGMKILQFAFDSGPDNPYLPENHAVNSVVYTGTHDNNTTLGWWQSLAKEQKDHVRDYLGKNKPEMPKELIRLAMASSANLCILPCQDILGLNASARFNTPGQARGNWSWQMKPKVLTAKLERELLNLTRKYHRTTLR